MVRLRSKSCLLIYPLNLQWRPTHLRVSPNRALSHQNGQVPTQTEETPDRNGHERITLKSCSCITIKKWKNKALHGQYPKILEKPHVDTVTTNKWLSNNLKGETEGLLVAAQDQAINTRNNQKVICGQQVESKCRMCSQHEEMVDHIVSGCEVLAKTEYISRHNNAAAYLHWSICKDHDVEITDKWYEHKPETVMYNKNNSITIMWDMPINTDRSFSLSRNKHGTKT